MTAFLSTLSLRRATRGQNPGPRTGTDFYPRSPCGERQQKCGDGEPNINFYPRSPCGERPGPNSITPDRYYFYPRSPCGERRIRAYQRHFPPDISIHALLAESDAPQQENGQAATISIHALLAESDLAVPRLGKRDIRISIHALLAESDARIIDPTYGQEVFLSTLSLRRATRRLW